MGGRDLPVIVVILVFVATMSGCIGDEEPNKSPEAFAGADVDAEVGEKIIFQGTGLDDDGSIVEYRWDYDGDGHWDYEGDQGARIHTYARVGSFKARLQVLDDEGAKAEDWRWVNVTTSVNITINWTQSDAYVVMVSEKLDASDLEVDWTLLNVGPTPITRTFNMDSGLVKVANGTYQFEPQLGILAAGQRHLVDVRLGEILIGSREVVVVNTSEPAKPYTVTYFEEVSDLRFRYENWTNYYRNGTVELDVQLDHWRGQFEGSGYENLFTNSSDIAVSQRLNLTNVTVLTGGGGDWGRTWWRWGGHGFVEQWSPTGFYAFAQIWDLERAIEDGVWTMDTWRRVGRYSGYNDTNGTFEWTRKSQGNMIHQNGEGELFEALKIKTERSFVGTDRGMNFTLHNLTFDYDASRDVFENRTLFRESDQEVGHQNETGAWLWTNSTFVGYLDENGDGLANPDPIPFDPERASEFRGPRPQVISVGDRFRATNPFGVSLYYKAFRTNTSNLSTPQGVVPVHGIYVEAIHNSTWGDVWHWFWVLEDGPHPGLTFEESVLVNHAGYGGGSYRRYRNILGTG
jgi:hypothetical protein